MALFVLLARVIFQTVFSNFNGDAFYASLVEGSKLALWVIGFGLINSLYDFRKLLKHSPRFLRGFATALSIAITLTPEMARNVSRVKQASRLRNINRRAKNIGAILVPVLSNAIDQAINLADSMRARGFDGKSKKIETQLELNNLSFGYRNRKVFQKISLKLTQGSFTLISGNTGSGKSTLLKLIQARVVGCAYVIQNPRESFISDCVRSELQFAADQAGSNKQSSIQTVAKEFGLTELLDVNPHELSAGWQQRVAIAAALTGGARFLVLDEPFSALDKEGTDQLLETLRQLKNLGITTVVAEHRIRLFKNLADQHLVIKNQGLVNSDFEPKPLEPNHPNNGKVTALIGENGSGKTTYLQKLASENGVLVPQPAGDILYLETVAQELAQADLESNAPIGTAEKLLEEFDIELDPNQNPRDLSSGEKLSLAIAIQLAKTTNLLLLDEPTVGFDAINRQRLVNQLSKLADRGVDVIVATHDKEFIDAVATEIIPIWQVASIAK